MIISVKKQTRYKLKNKDLFINKHLVFSEQDISMDADKSANLLLPSSLNVRKHRNNRKIYRKLAKIVNNFH